MGRKPLRAMQNVFGPGLVAVGAESLNAVEALWRSLRGVRDGVFKRAADTTC